MWYVYHWTLLTVQKEEGWFSHRQEEAVNLKCMLLAGTKDLELFADDDGFDVDYIMDEVDLGIDNYEELFGVGHNDPEHLFAKDGIDSLFGGESSYSAKHISANIMNREIPWPQVPDDMSFEASHLIDKLLSDNPLQRLGATGAGKRDECSNLAYFGSPHLNVNYSFSNFSFKKRLQLETARIYKLAGKR